MAYKKKAKKKATKKATKKQAPKKTRTKIAEASNRYEGAGMLAKDAATGRGFHAPMGLGGEGRMRHHDKPSAAAARRRDAMKWTGYARERGIELGQAVSSAASPPPPSKKKAKKKTKKRPGGRRR